MRALVITGAVLALACTAPRGGAQEAPPQPPPKPAPQAPPKPPPKPAPPRFQEVAEAAGLRSAAPFRVALSDLDGDGFPEAIFNERRPKQPGGRIRVFHNVAGEGPGGRVFREAADAWGLRAGGPAEPNGGESAAVFCIFGDIDNDGHVDCVRLAYNNPADHPKQPDTGERSAVLLGSDGPKFTLVPNSGLEHDGAVTTCAAVLVDTDRDGNLDLFTGNWYVHYGQSLVSHVNRLFKGDGTGHFTDVTQQAGLLTRPEPGHVDSSRPTYGVSHTDIDDDGWPDLVVATYGRQWNRLWHNNGDGTFSDWAPGLGCDGDANRDGAYPAWARANPRIGNRPPEPPFRSNGNTFGLIPHDLDNDGQVDFLSAAITHAWAGPSSDLSALLYNGGPKATPPHRLVRAPLKRETSGQYWNQGDVGGAVGDLDNDGRPDVLIASTAYPDGQRLWIYRQTGRRTFALHQAEWGVDLRDCNHVAVGDVNHDGALDILATGGTTRWNKRPRELITLYLNRPATAQHFIAFTLTGNAGRDGVAAGRGSNRSAIGARVWVTAGGVTQMREVLSSTGHFGQQNPRTLHVGLGAATTVDRVRVRWPDAAGTEQQWELLAADRRYELRQGEAEPHVR